jgi:hypothetical protein
MGGCSGHGAQVARHPDGGQVLIAAIRHWQSLSADQDIKVGAVPALPPDTVRVYRPTRGLIQLKASGSNGLGMSTGAVRPIGSKKQKEACASDRWRQVAMKQACRAPIFFDGEQVGRHLWSFAETAREVSDGIRYWHHAYGARKPG